MKQLLAIVFALCWLQAPLAGRPTTLEDMFKIHRLSTPRVSPDGHWVVYVVTDPSVAENRTSSALWLIPAEGGEPRRLTFSGHHDGEPAWSPDGHWIAFVSDRSGTDQIWILPMEGGEPHLLTSLATEAGQPVWSPDGTKLAFVSRVFPQFSGRPPEEAARLNRELLEAREHSKVRARLFTELLYRHWDSWVDGRRKHLFVLTVYNGNASGLPRDVTPGNFDAEPTSSTFSEGNDFDFSADGTELAFTAAPVPARTDAWSTNHDIWIVNLGTGHRRQVTINPAADAYPRYSPDGRYLAYRAQTRPGFESDRWQLMLLDLKSGEKRSLTPNFDSSVGAFAWTPDSGRLVFGARSRATDDIWEVGIQGGSVHALTPGADAPGALPAGYTGMSGADRTRLQRIGVGGSNTDFSLSTNGDIFYLRSTFTAPPNVWHLHREGAAWQAIKLTDQNEELFENIDLSAVDSVAVPGADGTPVQMWVVKPPNFRAGKRYPLVFWAHGGPQSPFDDAWSSRWNPLLWAAQGYVLALPNPHGSAGFGQAYEDEVSRDWGGKAYADLMDCADWLCRQSYVDPRHTAAAGASYGGYMMDWIEGHTDRFRTIVTHDGVYDFRSMYGTTDELWFEEWEHGQPWATADFDRFSPNVYAANFRTPMLIIHNEQDFRVPIGQGQELFTALQRRGIPSEFLSFPDEGHWVLKPGNSELWHKTIFAWLEKYLK